MQQFTYDGLDAQAHNRDDRPSRRVRWRLGVCAAALFLGLVISSVPIFNGQFGTRSLTWMTIDNVGRYAYAIVERRVPADEILRLQLFVSVLWALVLTQPVLIYHGLAMVGPAGSGKRKRARAVAAALLCVMCVGGLFFAFRFWIPVMVPFIGDSGWDPRAIDVPILNPWWTWDGAAWTVTSLYGLAGLGFQLPLWPTVLVRLRIARYGTLARLRRYVLLLTVIVGALVTPTTDLATLAAIAVPLYLLYEIGLLRARFIAPPLPRTGEGVGGRGLP